MSVASNLPPGVSPNDPHITGEWPLEDIIENILVDFDGIRSHFDNDFSQILSVMDDCGLWDSNVDEALRNLETAMSAFRDEISSKYPPDEYDLAED